MIDLEASGAQQSPVHNNSPRSRDNLVPEDVYVHAFSCCKGSLLPSKSETVSPPSGVKLHSTVSNCSKMSAYHPSRNQHLQFRSSETELKTHKSHPCPPHALKPHHSLPFRPFDHETNIDVSVHLIDTAPNPRQLLCEIDFISQERARLLVRPQTVQSAADDARVGFLVVEDGERAGRHNGREDREGAQPAVRRDERVEGSVGAAFH